MKKLILIIIIIASAIGFWSFMLFGSFPIPRGIKVKSDCYTYYKNFFGIYYISVENPLALFNHGHWGYLEDVDESTFNILDDEWAKDAKHVWHENKLIENVDVKTFHINKSGVAMDKNNVYIYEYSNGDFLVKPSQNGIDINTAEYFIYRLGERESEWMRDKDHIYHYDKKIDVDRNSFRIFGEDWFIDKNFVYITKYNSNTTRWDLCRIDSLQHPIKAGYLYLRNGRNIIYGDSVILRDIDVRRFKEIGVGKYIINDMVFLWGKPYLKDSLDVKNAKFYFHGRIAVDDKNVYFDNKRILGIDAATFKKVKDDTFEDKNYTYTIKDESWDNDIPFDKKKK